MKKIYRKAALLFTMAGISFSLHAQTFQQTYGGSNNDSGRDFEFTADGGILVAGETFSEGAGWSDIYLVKTNAMGVKQWTKTIGGIGDDHAYSIVKAPGGGYVIAGSTRSSGAGVEDFYLVKIDESGNVIWQKTYGTGGLDIGREAQPTPDGGYIFIGYTQTNGYDMMVVKTSSDGTEEWRKTYGGPQFENGYSVKAATDGYVLLGTTYTFSQGAGDAWVVKINNSGTQIWDYTFGGGSEEEGQYIEPSHDGGYILVYDQESNSMGDMDIGVTKITAQGAEVWSKMYGDVDKDVVKMVKQTADGGYMIAGITRSFGLINPDYWLIKINANGDAVWKKNYGGGFHEHCYAAKEDTNGTFVATGHADSFGAGMEDVWTIRVSSQGVLAVPSNKMDNVIGVYPNPASESVNIASATLLKDCNIMITAVSGQKVYEYQFKDMINESISIDKLSKGIYFLHVRSERGEQTTKLLID